MLAIFLEPKNELKNFITKWKHKIKKNYSSTKFINHPPHLTIYLANLTKQQAVIGIIQKIVDDSKSFKIIINKTNIFLNDEFTGNDTIFLNIKKNRNLFLLQKKIAENLKDLVNKKKDKKKILNQKLRESLLKYGFPFVGSHWKPHFTIGSIKDFKTKDHYKIFMKKKINFENNIKIISLWRINKEKHTKIKDFKFGK